MKKTGIALVSVLLAGSLVAFTACGNGDGTDIGKVDGNFDKEATEEEFGAALASVDTENAFGDFTADDWAYNLKIESVIHADISMSSLGMTMNYSIKSNTDAAVSLSKDNSQAYGFAVAGKAEESLELEMEVSTGKQSQSASAGMNANIYFDNSALYLDFATNGMQGITGQTDISEKGKVSVEELIAYIMEIIESTEPDLDPDDTIEGFELEADDAEEGGDIVEIEEEFTLSDLLDMMKEMGVKTYLDDSDGLKIKFSAGDAVKAEVDSQEVAFASCVLDFYLVFDANGAFKQFSIDTDLEMTVQSQVSVVVKGGVKISVSDTVVKLPEGIETDSSYKEIELPDISEIPGAGF